MAPTINQVLLSDRQTITNYMTEGGMVATAVAITTTTTIATIALAVSSPPKPVFLKIIGTFITGAILGVALAALVLRHYRKQILSNKV